MKINTVFRLFCLLLAFPILNSTFSASAQRRREKQEKRERHKGADRDKAVMLGYGSCAAVAPGPVAAASLSLSMYQACSPLPAEFGDLSWVATPVIGVGAGTFGPGSVRVQHDDVAVDFLK